MGTNLNFRNFTNDFLSSTPEAGRQQMQQPLTPLNFPLARQSSIYSLTFDEFQSTVGVPGKDFGSMNMDELLKNIWSAEENQNQNVAAAAAAAAGAMPVNDGLQRQGSLTLPRTLSQKTVDDVWKDIWKEYGSGANERSEVVPQRQQTLGEMTLEEFLVRAGVVREENNSSPVAVGKSQQSNGGGGGGGFFADLARQGNNNSNNNNSNGFGMVGLSSSNGNTNPVSMQPGSNLHLNVNVNGGARSNQAQSLVHQQQQQQQQQQIFPKQANNVGGYGLSLQGIGGANGLMQGGMVSPASQISSDGIGKSNGDTSSVSPVPYAFHGSMRGRRPNTAVEKVVERRQRRMIKNRESAARSRARKQAYTMELEAEVAKLKEENEELRRKQEEIAEVQKNQEMEMMSMENGGKRRCLRRTQTGPW